MSAPRVRWQVTLSGTSAEVRFDPVDADRDCALIHDWMNRPHVSPWWELDRPYEQIHDYLTSLTHLRPWLVSTGDVPFGYVETYRVADDPLAAYIRAGDGDLGWHVLVGPQEMLGTGVPRLLGRAVLAYLLNHANRVVCEPDARNARMHTFCERLGHRSLGEVDLPEKRARLMACTRDDFDARWPEDRRTVAAASTYEEVSR